MNLKEAIKKLINNKRREMIPIIKDRVFDKMPDKSTVSKSVNKTLSVNKAFAPIKNQFDKLDDRYQIGILESADDIKEVFVQPLKNTFISHETAEAFILAGLFETCINCFSFALFGTAGVLWSFPVASVFVIGAAILWDRKESTGKWLLDKRVVEPEEETFSIGDIEDVIDEIPVIEDPIPVNLIELGENVVHTLKEYGYRVVVTGYSDEAPMVVIYKIVTGEWLYHNGERTIQYQKGIKIEGIEDLGANLARDLGLDQGLTIGINANIGNNQAALYIPKKVRDWVYTKDYLKELEDRKETLPLFLGKTLDCNTLVADLVDAPHLLIGGKTKSGKTVSVLSQLLTLAYLRSPKVVNFVLIDPKLVGLTLLDRLPHCKTPSIIDMRDAMNSLEGLVDDMMWRYSLIRDKGVQDIKEYNKLTAESMVYKVVVVDEFLMGIDDDSPIYDEEGKPIRGMSVGKQIKYYLTRLAIAGRGAGIHLILLTQRFAAEDIPGTIRSNVDMGICFSVPSKSDSRMIIKETGGETLLGFGDSLVKMGGWPSAVRVQGGGFHNDSEEITDLAKMIQKKWEDDLITFQFIEGSDTAD